MSRPSSARPIDEAPGIGAEAVRRELPRLSVPLQAKQRNHSLYAPRQSRCEHRHSESDCVSPEQGGKPVFPVYLLSRFVRRQFAYGPRDQYPWGLGLCSLGDAETFVGAILQ